MHLYIWDEEMKKLMPNHTWFPGFFYLNERFQKMVNEFVINGFNALKQCSPNPNKEADMECIDSLAIAAFNTYFPFKGLTAYLQAIMNIVEDPDRAKACSEARRAADARVARLGAIVAKAEEGNVRKGETPEVD